MQAVLQIYDAKIDSRKRITLRNAKYDYYNVQELEDGRIIMEPRVLTPPFEISANTLSMMDSSIKKRRNKFQTFMDSHKWLDYIPNIPMAM